MRDNARELLVREIDQKGVRHQGDARFYGLYRGICVQNDDNHVLRRIKVRVTEFYGEDPRISDNSGDPPAVALQGGLKTEDLPWAHPCSAPSETNAPSIGDAVWVLFEKGDPARPVWMGVYKTAPFSLSDAVVGLFNVVKDIFKTKQTEGAIQPPPPETSPVPTPTTTDLDKTKRAANDSDIDARFLWALRLTENGRPGREFGVLNRKDATDFDGQAKLAAQTVHNTEARYRRNIGREPIGQDGRYTGDFVDYFSKGGPGYGGYAPVGAANDPNNLNSNHANNLKTHYGRTDFE